MKVVHISPNYFGKRSVLGGGERYAYGLAKTMAKSCETIFVSFSDKPASYRDGSLRIEHLRSRRFRGRRLLGLFSWHFAKWILWADVVHCYQTHVLSTNLAVLLGKILRKKIFVSDLAGASLHVPSRFLPILRQADGFLLISQHDKTRWDKASWHERPRKLKVIRGGVDTELFSPGQNRKPNGVLAAGRIAPYKGLHVLVEALDSDMELSVVGQIHDKTYFDHLKSLCLGKQVAFSLDVSDAELVQKYREARVTVIPALRDGGYTAALESLACGTPVIGTTVGCLPELIEDGVTGFLVRPGDPGVLREKIRFLFENPTKALEMGAAGRKAVLKQFGWESVVEQCLKEYGADHNG